MENGWRNTQCILSETADPAAAGLTEAWLTQQQCVVCPEALPLAGQELCPFSLCGVTNDNRQNTIINAYSIKTQPQDVKVYSVPPKLIGKLGLIIEKKSERNR